ncbi:MAG: rRNA maturation RNase YbeY [Balneolaceae bacterium]|nr:rRNA maturation RNase YbeY [Balneolaceae bacterium]
MSGEYPLQLFNRSGTGVPLTPACAREAARLVEKGENCRFSLLEIVYVDEEAIREINREYLDRTYVTDIITFRYDTGEEASPAAETKSGIEATLYCCASRIAEQAADYGEGEGREFRRILLHGLLHLAGYGDDTPARKKEMTRREEHYLSMLDDR